jgi:sodium/proline symporter
MVTTITFIAYAAIIVGIGIAAARHSKESALDVHLAGREHGTWTSALSASVSTESGFVLLGMVGMGYQVGINALWIVPAGVAGYLLNWKVLAPDLREKSDDLDAVTVPEFVSRATNDRFSRAAGALAGILGIIFLMAYVAAQFSAAGKAISGQFDLSYLTATGFAAAFVAAYALVGGFRAVSWSDTLQAGMMAFALIILPIVVIQSVGGVGSLFAKLREIDPALVSLTGGATTVSGILMAVLPWLMLGLAYPGQPHAIARLMAAEDRKVFKWAPVIAIVWFILVYSGAVFLGMAAHAGFADLQPIANDPEQVLPVLADRFLPGVLAGTVLAAIIAAITSTADSTLMASATTLARDLREALGLAEPERELLWTRVAILLLSVIATVFAFQETPVVFDIVLVAWAGLGSSLGPTILYCALVDDPKGIAALSGLLTGGGLAFALQSFEIDLLLGFTASAVVVGVVHAVAKYADQREIEPA